MAGKRRTEADDVPYLLPLQLALGAALLGIWELAGANQVSSLASRPSLVLARLWLWITTDLHVHVATTLTEMILGLAIGTTLGVLAGITLGRSPLLSTLLRPLIVAAYSVPLIALVPLIIMFFGIDMLPKIVLISIVVFFLLLFNTFSGVQAIDKDMIASIQIMGSTQREEFQKVIAPAAMAWIIGGVKTALPYALVAATTGEMLASRSGVGFLVMRGAQRFDMPALYAGLLVLMIIGLLISDIATRIEKWMLRWRHAAE
uniref:Putative binding-protein-dependent transport systems inner membrane component n=1 Tax=uncultured bacterium 1114 TaxID=548901 RepID=B8R937_9BACT|nr:putative binding-protein-dependent transport systems inner membrane component [uncultured bacterium 1114]